MKRPSRKRHFQHKSGDPSSKPRTNIKEGENQLHKVILWATSPIPAHTQAHTHMGMYTPSHTYTSMRIHGYVHPSSHTQACTQGTYTSNIHWHVYPHNKQTCINIGMYTSTNTYTIMDTQACIPSSHTHTQACTDMSMYTPHNIHKHAPRACTSPTYTIMHTHWHVHAPHMYTNTYTYGHVYLPHSRMHTHSHEQPSTHTQKNNNK